MEIREASVTVTVTLQASGVGLFYIRVNVKALVTGSITKWSVSGGLCSSTKNLASRTLLSCHATRIIAVVTREAEVLSHLQD